MNSTAMTAEELVRGWKDPESRTGELSYHPSGQVDLDAVGGKKDGNTISTVSTVTVLTVTTTGPTVTTVTTITTTVTAAP